MLRLKRRGVLFIIEILLMSFLLTLNVVQSVEAAGVKYLTLVSLTFDDGLRESAAIQPLLDSGLKATFYVNSNRIRLTGPIDNNDFLTKGEIDTLFNNGYEIGGHTIDHVDLATLSDAAQLQAICDDLATLRGWYGDNIYSLAYPYTSTGPATQGIVAGGCPGTYGSLNKPVGKYESGRAGGGLGCQECSVAESLPAPNPYHLATTDAVVSTTTLATLQSYVTQAEINGGGWVPLVFHSVCNGCSTYAVTQEMLINFLTWLRAREPQGTYVKTVHQVMSGDYPPLPPPPPLGPNLIINPSLEVVVGNNNLPDCWQLGDWGSSTATWTRTTDAYTGGFAQRLQITAYNNGDRKLMPTLDAGQMSGGCAPPVDAGTNYQVSAYYKSTTPSTFILFYLNANGVWQYWRDGPNLPASNDWSQMTYQTGTLPVGAKAMSFGIALSSVGTLTTDEYSMSKILDTNTAPTFVGGTTTLTVQQNSSALDLKPNLHVSDTDIGQTVTWSLIAAPVRGTLTISSATASSGSANITPGGTITYTPAAGYSGSDNFTVQVSDGVAIATRVFTVTVTAAPSNTVPTFIGGSTNLQVGMNSSALDLNPSLHVSDTDTGQTLTWSPSAAPIHGTLTISGATASSGSTNITPGGTITYQPTAGYSGSDSFTVQVSDGLTTANRTITMTVTSTNLGPNLLINPSLEVVGSNNQPNCWQQGGYGTNTFTWTRTTDAYTGSFAQQLQIASYTNGDRKLLPTLDVGQASGGCAPSVDAGAAYQISAYYKSTASSSVVLYYLDANGVWQYWKTGPNLPAANDWAQMTYQTGTLPVGAKAMSFGTALSSVGTLTTDEYSIAKILDGSTPTNTAPTFVGGTTTLTVPQNSSALDLNPSLHVSDTDTGQTLTWSPSAAPIHGTLTISGATASSGSINITPGGTITYQPTAGYSGSDSFTVQVSDGLTTANRTITMTVTSTNLGPNLLINPSLEVVGSNNQPNCWQQGGYGTNTFTWTRTTDAYTGSFAQQLQIASYTNGDRKLLPTLDVGQASGGCAPSVDAGAAYQISAYYKSTASSSVVLYYLDANGVWQYWKTGPNLPAANDWAQMTYQTGTLPVGAKAMSFGTALSSVGTLTTDEYSIAKILDGSTPAARQESSSP
ncbi:tandem-95 repeat protein [Methylobacter sp. G7]|uniref:tandem-95 repeat protein n=1 Tax=Methylobacter sp. G7 TaxID=3230117 RepID=UPI003D802D43